MKEKRSIKLCESGIRRLKVKQKVKRENTRATERKSCITARNRGSKGCRLRGGGSGGGELRPRFANFLEQFGSQFGEMGSDRKIQPTHSMYEEVRFLFFFLNQSQ